MTSRGINRRQTSNQQIVIQEENQEMSEVEECISFEKQQPFYKNGCDSTQIIKQYSSDALKINKQKLLKYQPLKQKNRYQNNHFKCEPTYTKNQTTILNTTFRKSNSIKMLKQIKHKVEICSKRLKTTSDKQNDLHHFLPKMPSRMLHEPNNKMNKTVSAINFWRQSSNTVNVCEELNQSKKTYVESRLKTDNESTNKKKVSQDGFKLNSNRSHIKMSRNFNKTTSLSKFNTNNEITYSNSDIINILAKINENQEELVDQKTYLQQRIAALREGIQKQNALIVEINKNKQRISTSLAKKESESKHSINGAKLSKKKNQNFQLQTKDLEQKLQETAHTNNIQEKELIRMYEMVIQEVKSQLKVQKKQKLQLQKKITILKKNQKSLYSKLCSHESNNKEIMRKVYNSLQKWQ